MRCMNYVILLLFFSVSTAFPQSATVQVTPNNKTISVTAEHTVSVEPEIAVLRFRYRNTAPQKEVAYRENLKAAENILNALKNAGIRDGAISTRSIRVERQEPDEDRPVKPEMLQSVAFQEWAVVVPAREAQSVVDLVMGAGVNALSNPEWTVVDPVALEAKAYGSALAKARKIAEQMALGLGAELGDLVYATNSLNLAHGASKELPSRRTAARKASIAQVRFCRSTNQ